MKSIIIFLFVGILSAQSVFIEPMPKRRGAVSGGGGATYTDTTTNVLVYQNFEGTGYDRSETWTAEPGSGGTVDPDYTTTILRGAQSMRLGTAAGASPDVYNNSFTAQPIVYGFFRWQVRTSGAYGTLIFLDDSTFAHDALGIVLGSNFSTWTLNRNDAATTATGTYSISLNTTYFIWFDYNKVAGTANLYIGTTGTFADATHVVTLTGGANTYTVKYLLLFMKNNVTSGVYLFDQVLLKTTSIGDMYP